MIWGVGFRVQGLGFRVPGFRGLRVKQLYHCLRLHRALDEEVSASHPGLGSGCGSGHDTDPGFGSGSGPGLEGFVPEGYRRRRPLTLGASVDL
jgi:hypothetical protein